MDTLNDKEGNLIKSMKAETVTLPLTASKKRKRKESEKSNDLIDSPWTAEEDDIIRNAALHYAPEWKRISELIPGRSSKQVRNRFLNNLKPDRTKKPWSPEEDNFLIETYEGLTTSWAEIARMIPGRTDNDVKNRWHTIQRYARKKAGLTAPHGGNRVWHSFHQTKKK